MTENNEINLIVNNATESEIAINTLHQLNENFFRGHWGYIQLFEDEESRYSNAIKKVLKELEQYRAIGTVEEFKALKEKNEPKKPITYTKTNRADCPICKATVRGIDKPFGDYCNKCGKKLDWE